MFYEISAKSLAQFIGNTCFDLVTIKANSDKGYRTDGCSQYDCKFHSVDIKVNDIKVDTFLDPKGDITCIIHIPPTKFHIITEELSRHYPNRDKLSFVGVTNPVDEKLILRNINPQSMDDFTTTLEAVVTAAENYITNEIVEHRNKATWKVCCDNVTVNYDKIFHNER